MTDLDRLLFALRKAEQRVKDLRADVLRELTEACERMRRTAMRDMEAARIEHAQRFEDLA